MFVANSILFIICSSFVTLTHQKTGEFWQFTDFHWDQNYTRFGGNASAMCWASNESSVNASLDDVGRYGNYQCDAPWELVSAVLSFAKQRQPNPDFIVWTGDDDSHVSDAFFSPEKVSRIMRTVTSAINATFPSTPVLPTFGNHDAFPKSCFSPISLTSWYTEVADIWKDWFTPQAYQTFTMGGYYQMAHPTLTNVTVIGLNTNVYYNKNKLVGETKDPNPLNQLSWLNATLTQLAADNRSAYIISHVPPGVFGRYVTPKGERWFRHRFNTLYVNIIVKHAAFIKGQFYGHDHTDSFKIYFNKQGEPVNLLFVSPAVTPGYTSPATSPAVTPGEAVNMHFVAPAVTPWNTTLPTVGPNNPGLRLYTYDLQTGDILNYEQFYLNLTEANRNGQADFLSEYDFLSAYNLPDMSPPTVFAMVRTFATPNRTYFDKYYQYNSASYVDASGCDVTCQRNTFCSIVNVNYDAFTTCNAQNLTSADDWIPNDRAKRAHEHTHAHTHT